MYSDIQFDNFQPIIPITGIVIKKYGEKKAYVINTYGNLKNKYQDRLKYM